MGALSDINLEPDDLADIAERLADEAPNAAALITAMTTFLAETEERCEDLLAETIDMRRSHLTALLAVAQDTRARLAEVLRGVDLDGRLPDADLVDPVHDGLNTTGDALAAIVGVLARNPHTS
ncbi:hypothetical protein [Actinoallomurus sp. CA-142502]|uniref:hypothetical protein n=1 Tax=Actinoallomurus sp. CA-142502 TaxID=3239885 RepID=UPI003D8B48F8